MSSFSSSNRDRVLAVWKCIEERDFSAILDLISDDFKLSILPTSLGIPTRTKNQIVDILKGVFEKIPSVQITANEWVENEDTVAAHYVIMGTRADGSPHKVEYMGFYKFKSDGKLVDIKEFVDSKFMTEFFAKNK